jgi:acyl-CoA synthetase (NDP forming)
MLVDQLALSGVDVQPPAPQTYERLAQAGVEVARAPVVDLTLAGTRYDKMKATLDVLLTAPEFDFVVAVVGSSARTRPDLAIMPIVDSAGAPNLAAFVVPHAPEASRRLTAANVPNFTSPETCADVIAAALRRRQPIYRPMTALEPGPRRHLSEAQSYRLLADLPIPAAPHLEVPSDAVTAETGLPFPYPVVVKVSDPEIVHKSDVGGVVLSVAGPDELAEAASRLRVNLGRHRPGRRLARLLIQQMVGSVGELLVGYRLDMQVGPVVVLAAGGVATEVYHDRSIRLAPVDDVTAREMIAEVRAVRLLSGYRGKKAGDIEAVAAAIVAMSRLAGRPEVLEAEVNPLVVREAGLGVLAVDAFVVVRDTVSD